MSSNPKAKESALVSARIRAKAWYAANKEAKKEYDREYRCKNREKINSYAAKWRKKNYDTQIAKERIRNAASPQYAVMKAKWRKENVEKLRVYEENRAKTVERRALTKACSAAWRKANPEVARNHVRNRRAKLRDGGVLSKDIEKTLMAAQDGKCAICRRCILEKFHLDHIIPVARGGRNEDDNAQLLCPPCNQSKGAKLPYEFKGRQHVDL